MCSIVESKRKVGHTQNVAMDTELDKIVIKAVQKALTVHVLVADRYQSSYE